MVSGKVNTMTTHSTDNSDEKTGKTSYTTDTTWKLGQDEKKLHYSYESTEESKTETAVTDLITGTKQTIERNSENGNVKLSTYYNKERRII